MTGSPYGASRLGLLSAALGCLLAAGVVFAHPAAATAPSAQHGSAAQHQRTNTAARAQSVKPSDKPAKKAAAKGHGHGSAHGAGKTTTVAPQSLSVTPSQITTTSTVSTAGTTSTKGGKKGNNNGKGNGKGSSSAALPVTTTTTATSSSSGKSSKTASTPAKKSTANKSGTAAAASVPSAVLVGATSQPTPLSQENSIAAALGISPSQTGSRAPGRPAPAGSSAPPSRSPVAEHVQTPTRILLLNSPLGWFGEVVMIAILIGGTGLVISGTRRRVGRR